MVSKESCAAQRLCRGTRAEPQSLLAFHRDRIPSGKGTVQGTHVLQLGQQEAQRKTLSPCVAVLETRDQVQAGF